MPKLAPASPSASLGLVGDLAQLLQNPEAGTVWLGPLPPFCPFFEASLHCSQPLHPQILSLPIKVFALKHK